MNLIKIAVSVKKRFAELYEIRLYRKQSAYQFAVRQYKTVNQEIIVDGEK